MREATSRMLEASSLTRCRLHALSTPCLTPSSMRHATVLLVASEAWRGRKGEPLVWDAFTDVSASPFGHRRYENTNHVQLTPDMSTLCR